MMMHHMKFSLSPSPLHQPGERDRENEISHRHNDVRQTDMPTPHFALLATLIFPSCIGKNKLLPPPPWRQRQNNRSGAKIKDGRRLFQANIIWFITRVIRLLCHAFIGSFNCRNGSLGLVGHGKGNGILFEAAMESFSVPPWIMAYPRTSKMLV